MLMLTFNGEEGASRYEICMQAILLTDRPVQVAEWSDVVALQQKFKQLGRPAQTEKGIMLYDLDHDGVVVLERAEMRLLIDFIERPIWRPHVLPQVVEVRAWLVAAKDEPVVRAVP